MKTRIVKKEYRGGQPTYSVEVSEKRVEGRIPPWRMIPLGYDSIYGQRIPFYFTEDIEEAKNAIDKLDPKITYIDYPLKGET